MAIAVEMPKMSDTMEEGVLVAWSVEEGATVSPGDVIAQVETDKATMDLEAYDDGVLLKKVVPEGSSIPIGGLIAVLGKAGESPDDILASYSDSAGSSASVDSSTSSASGDGAATTMATPAVAVSEDNRATTYATGDGRIKASPLARKLAADHGLSLPEIRGTGPDGRIVKRDIEAAMGNVQSMPMSAVQPSKREAPTQTPATVRSPSAAPAKQAADVPAVPLPKPTFAYQGDSASSTPDVVRISQMRKAIARRLSESKFSAPHFYLTVDVDMAACMSAREQVNAAAEATGRLKVSYNDFVTKACAAALRLHRGVNASWMEEQGIVEMHNQVHVAIAVAIDDGLVTPVVRNADRKGLEEIAYETRELAGRARNRQLQPDEFQGSTFTTSNLGMFGIQEFTAIINPPNACILAIGAIRDEAVVKDGAVVAGKRMKLTLSCDHRVVDGATGAEFLRTVQRHLEQPATMLL